MMWEVEFRSKKVINNEIVVRLKKKKKNNQKPVLEVKTSEPFFLTI